MCNPSALSYALFVTNLVSAYKRFGDRNLTREDWSGFAYLINEKSQYVYSGSLIVNGIESVTLAKREMQKFSVGGFKLSSVQAVGFKIHDDDEEFHYRLQFHFLEIV